MLAFVVFFVAVFTVDFALGLAFASERLKETNDLTFFALISLDPSTLDFDFLSTNNSYLDFPKPKITKNITFKKIKPAVKPAPFPKAQLNLYIAIQFRTINATPSNITITINITKAKKGGLNNRRLIASRLNSLECAQIVCDVIAPQIKRDSGYLKIEHAGFRRGDNAEMGTISFVDEIDYTVKEDK